MSDKRVALTKEQSEVYHKIREACSTVGIETDSGEELAESDIPFLNALVKVVKDARDDGLERAAVMADIEDRATLAVKIRLEKSKAS